MSSLSVSLRFAFTLLLYLVMGLPLAANAQAIAVQNLAVLVDADGSETIASVSAPGAAQRFTPLDGLFSAGYTRKVHWLRFSVQAPAAGSWWLEVMPPFLDDLRLFTPDGATFAERRSGDRLPFASREEDYRGFIFKLALADSAPQTFYLRLQTTSASLVTLQLWQPERFQGSKDFDYVVMGFLLGVFLLVLLLNLLLWWGTREPLYGWFSLLVGANLLLNFAFTGLTAQYLLPQMPLLADAAVSASVLIFLGATAPFYRRMLRVERDQKFYFYVFRAMLVLPCVLLISLFTGHYPEAARIAVSFSGLSALLILYLSSRLSRDGRREARHLLLAAVLVLLTRIFGVLFSLDLLPGALGVNVLQLQRWLPLAVTLIMQVALAVRLQEASKVNRQEAQRALLIERDRLRKEVQEHEARWTGAVDAIGEGIWEWDIASGEMLRSRVFDAALGYSEQDLSLTAEAWVELIHPDDLASNVACLQNYLTGKSATYAIEMRLRTKDGNYRWIACRGTGIGRDAAGAPTRMIGMHTDISARKQAQLDLVQSLAENNAVLERMQHAERFAQGTVDAISASLAILDASGVILSVNQAWRQIAQTHGGGSDLLCEGTNYLAVCDAASGASSEGAHEMAAGIRCVIQGIQGIQDEFILEYPCGSPPEKRWFSSRVTRFQGAGVIRVVVAHEDISTRKRADLARDEVQALLQNIADRVPGMVYQYHLRVDGSSHFPYVSESIRQIYRVSPQQAFENAAAVFAVLHPDDHDIVVIAIQQSAADLTPWQQEYRVKFDDGTARWLMGSALPQRQPDGGTLWHGFITDITERKKTEAALAEKAQLLVTVLANSSVGIIFIRDRVQVWSNRRIGEMFGYTSAELENQSPGLIFPTVQSQEAFVRAIYPALDRDGRFSTRCEMRRKDGSLFWVSLSGTSVDRNDPGAGSIWVAEDISKQRKTETALLVANDELTFQNEEKGKRAAELVIANDELTFQNEEKGKLAVELTTARDDAESANLAKSRFLATMSHEIRTPMNAVLGMAQVLLQPNISEANRLDYARTILTSGQTLLALLNDILDLSKIEAGKVDLEAIAMQPAQLLSETRSLFKPTADLKGLKLDVNWSGPVGTYLGDPHRLSQMLSNLVGNAIKFTSQGSIHVEAAEVACIDDDATLEFSVSDSGVGIAPDKLELLFQNFSQVDSSTTRNYGGTGLGLSIVRTLAQLMGGEVGVQSEVGAGSRFWFRIRARRLQGASHGAVQSSGMVAPDPGALITFDARVLVVEDNLQNQKVALALLKLLGASVSLAQNGQQALLMSRSVDLILMDLEMPLLDGYQATQQIRQWELSAKQPRRPIIALTASAFAEDRQRCLQAGMDEVMTKPMELNVLTAALRRWLPGAVSEPVATAASSEPAKVLDVARAQGLMHELEPLLENLQYKAFARFKDLQELARATPLAPLLLRADAALQAYQFGVALAELQKLMADPAWQGEPIESE